MGFLKVINILSLIACCFGVAVNFATSKIGIGVAFLFAMVINIAFLVFIADIEMLQKKVQTLENELNKSKEKEQ